MDPLLPVPRFARPLLPLAILAGVCCLGPARLSAASGPYSSAPNVSAATLPPRGGKLAADLAAAEAAWRQMADPATPRAALFAAEARYAAATGRVVAGLNGVAHAVLPGNVPPWDWHRPDATIRLGRYQVTLAGPGGTPGTWKPGSFDKVLWVERPAQNPTVPQALRPGIGAPLLGVYEGTAARRAGDPGLPRRGYDLPATAILDFGAGSAGHGDGGVRAVSLRLLDPREVRQVAVGRGRAFPLAADFATPAREQVGVRNFGYLSILGFLRPERALDDSGLFFFGPYDPDKIPVVFIHGLNSDPSIWENSTADLLADPEISRRCQFWYFFYPTGSAVTASAERLRAALDAFRARYDPAGNAPGMDRLILVGHSMGGLLAHLQVVSTGDELYHAYFAVPPEALDVPESFRQRVRRNLFFRARRDVGQVVFICTPHRGSRIADWGPVRLLARLIAVPERVLSVTTQILTLNTDLLSPAMRRSGLRGLSSIDSLSPRNPYYGALEKLPITRPFDTIVGNRGVPGPLRDSSDGVVGYWSAHWQGARSETVVPYGHQCAMRPDVVARVHQIIRQDVAEDTGRRAGRHPGQSPQAAVVKR